MNISRIGNLIIYSAPYKASFNFNWFISCYGVSINCAAMFCIKFDIWKKSVSGQHCSRWWPSTVMQGHISFQWRHDYDCVTNRRRLECLLKLLFKCRSKKPSKLHIFCEGNSAATGEFPSQRTSNEENVFIWWRHYVGSVMEIVCLVHWAVIGSVNSLLG